MACMYASSPFMVWSVETEWSWEKIPDTGGQVHRTFDTTQMWNLTPDISPALVGAGNWEDSQCGSTYKLLCVSTSQLVVRRNASSFIWLKAGRTTFIWPWSCTPKIFTILCTPVGLQPMLLTLMCSDQEACCRWNTWWSWPELWHSILRCTGWISWRVSSKIQRLIPAMASPRNASWGLKGSSEELTSSGCHVVPKMST